jgi:hypothetical protein
MQANLLAIDARAINQGSAWSPDNGANAIIV